MRLKSKKVVFTRIEPRTHIEFTPTFWLMRLFLPRMLFRIEERSYWTFYAPAPARNELQRCVLACLEADSVGRARDEARLTAVRKRGGYCPS